MIYLINHEKVSAKEFKKELDERIKTYIPYSEYYPHKDEVREELYKEGKFVFFTYDKRYKDMLIPIKRDEFIVTNQKILDIAEIVEANEYDSEDDDALSIAKALYDAGYRKSKETIIEKELKRVIKKINAANLMEWNNRFEIRLIDYKGSNRLMAHIKMVDNLLNETEDEYVEFYKLGNKYSSWHIWEKYNEFVINRKEKHPL